MSLAAGNAHLEQYYSYDLPNLMQTVDDGTLEKCKDFMIKWLENEFSCAKQTFESVSLGVEQVQQTSAELTNQIYLNEPTCNCLRYVYLTLDSLSCLSCAHLMHSAYVQLQRQVGD